MAVRLKWCEFKLQCRLLNACYDSSRRSNFSSSATCYAQGKPEKKKYTNTIALPRTNFPLRLDSQKRIDRDKYLNEKCKFSTLYNWQRKHVQGPEFILHDGPPYANGKPHMGHAINKILKDIISRHKLLQGYRIHYIPGWDCHGLPIELKALDGRTDLSAVEIRKKAEQFARAAISEQKDAFCSWGVMADWDTSYFTFDKSYVKNQLQQFLKLYEMGLVYRDVKPVFWSPSSRTALAEAELEYNPAHRSTAVTVRLAMQRIPDSLQASVPNNTPLFALVWTTTPWTLPANQAVCFSPDISYSLVSIAGFSGEVYIVASDLVDMLRQKLDQQVDIISTFSGNSLSGATYHRPFKSDQAGRFLPASHVTTSKGTGLVHSAPAHGPEDFVVALEHSIPVESLVDEDGRYTVSAGPELQGLAVLSSGTEAVLRLISADVMHSEQLVHSYPYDWRTKQPVILRASRQWFIDTNRIKHEAIEALKGVQIYPEHSSSARSGGGLMNQLERRPFWCISRQRVWGVPIPVLYHKETGKPLLSQSFINHLCDLMEEHGTDFWWTLPLERLAPQETLTELNVSLDEVEKGQDILDIWFDSGISWSSVLSGEKVADLYLEGLDQFTGWFQSSLMTSVALRSHAPYRAVFVHGFAVDAEGRKMSKSLGNVVDPLTITCGGKDRKREPVYGVDTLRWWVACHATQHSSVPVSQNVLEASAEAVHKLRIVLRFLLGALHDFPRDAEVPIGGLYLLDHYLLHLLLDVHQEVNKMHEQYQFHRICNLLTNFVTNEVSALYCHLIKDRLYCEAVDAPSRRACQLVVSHILEIITRAIAPVLPHLAEEVYMYHPSKEGELLFRSGMLQPSPEWHQPEVEPIVNCALEVKRAINKMVPTTNSQQLAATIFTSGETFRLLKMLQKEECSSWSELVEILQVSSVTLVESDSPVRFHLEVAETSAHLCGRCRRFTAQASHEHCDRCHQVLLKLGSTAT
ncbi:isoleucine--tRNA ligase, mitochondrial [Periplaneta americana]|uniref:isoleucine--tRNA ligase, mitochondrial n=1 Tax=Periplaneta americana TaxID=6978 RepID=UPI0037E78B81